MGRWTVNSANHHRPLLFTCALAVPCAAHATTAFPPFLWLYLASLFVFIPVVALVALVRIGVSWRRGLLGGEWMIAAIAACGAGAAALWAAIDTASPVLTPANWPLIYLALVPVLAVWFRSWRAAFAASGGRVGQFSSDEEFFRAVNELIAKLEQKGQQSAAAMLRDGFQRLNGLTDGWALFLKSIDGVSARSKSFDTSERRTLNVIRAAVNNAVSRR